MIIKRKLRMHADFCKIHESCDLKYNDYCIYVQKSYKQELFLEEAACIEAIGTIPDRKTEKGKEE